MNTKELRAALASAGVDPGRLRIAGERPEPTVHEEWAEDVLLLTHSARTGRWLLKGGQEAVPGWPGVLRVFEEEGEACRFLLDELARSERPALAAERGAWVLQAAGLRARAEAELAITHPGRAEQRRRHAAGRTPDTRAGLRDALSSSGAKEPYWIDEGPAEPVDLSAFDPDDEETWTLPDPRPWPPDVFVLAWDPFDELWTTGSRRAGAQPDIHLRFRSEGEACAYVFELLTHPASVPPRITTEQWRALRSAVVVGAP
ncbi:hypothetical protein [Streptacidiphilus rugosus]|uniref:hypothetical protein n=1 Tax=Streptacidiphilus rugosus TaxID=405783 RepID=UPI000568BC3D|nr:hypothetical protein [Streptacidiphilus rugosus]